MKRFVVSHLGRISICNVMSIDSYTAQVYYQKFAKIQIIKCSMRPLIDNGLFYLLTSPNSLNSYYKVII